MTEKLYYVPIQDIQTNPYQPRQYFHQEDLQELAQSIKENGIIQPLIVRKSPILGYELMAGERRLRASQLAGLDNVPVIIKELSDDDMMNQAIIENLQRKDLSPIEEARAYKRLIERGNTHEMIAQTMGKSRPYISNTIRLLQLSDKVLEALEAEKISQAHARTLLIFEDEKLQEEWLTRIIQQKLSVRQLETLTSPKKKIAKNTGKTVFIKEAEKKLSQDLGTKVSISETQKGSGHLSIPFSSLEELERLIHILSDRSG
ncbi:ParB family chromosome partitioning protein [Streptococcus rupicaprae]|uniref:ParB family chromosome partitioning protein n=1 Tax=Streptococcus rupicaprae TaxID=759619 RepID=A0ABV2FHL3_9STRE